MELAVYCTSGMELAVYCTSGYGDYVISIDRYLEAYLEVIK